MTYEQALAAGKKIGASRASDAEAMALFCDSPLQILVGAVSPAMVWEAAQRKGMTALDLARLCASPPAVHDLMWEA